MDQQDFIRVVFGTILAISIAHLSLKNLLKEPVMRDNPKNKDNPHNKRKIPLEDSKGDLLKYINNNLRDMDTVNDFGVKGYNYYLENNHEATPRDQKTDLSVFFNDKDYYDVVQRVKTNIGDEIADEKKYHKNGKDTLSGGDPMYYDTNAHGGLSLRPDFWEYKDENVMNGGTMDGGITGADNMLASYSTFGKPITDGISQESTYGTL